VNAGRKSAPRHGRQMCVRHRARQAAFER
jgi:hypothetical protein